MMSLVIENPEMKIGEGPSITPPNATLRSFTLRG